MHSFMEINGKNSLGKVIGSLTAWYQILIKENGKILTHKLDTSKREKYDMCSINLTT